MNDDALDDQWDRFDRARALAAAAHDEWLRYRDMEAGRPAMKAAAPTKPKQTLRVRPSGAAAPWMAIMQRMQK